LRKAWEVIQVRVSVGTGAAASSIEECFWGEVIDAEEADSRGAVEFDAAGFDEFDSVLWPVEGLGYLFAGQAGLAAGGAESLA
jgi:hypothetical protein